MTQYILTIDQGTTSSRCIIFASDGSVVSTAQYEFQQHFPHNGWVEHQPQDLLDTVIKACRQALQKSGLSAKHITCVGITNQRETTLVWDKRTGDAIYPAIVWQDRRTTDLCNQLKRAGHETAITEKTGLLLDPYFSATKISWILDNVQGSRALAQQGQLLFGTVDSYLMWHLSQGSIHSTDATNASRTMLFNLHTQAWDDELLALFNIPASMLPQIKDSAADFGYMSDQILGHKLPIQGVAGDQQAALFGQACFEPGMAKSTYGTGCFLMLNTGDKPLTSSSRLLTTMAYRLNGKPVFAIEGSIFVAGAAIQWLRDGLHLIKQTSEVEALAQSVATDHGVYMVPAFTGLGAPYWDPDARGAVFGLTRDTGIAEMVSAGVQSVCYQTKDLQKAMQNDGVRLDQLRVDGGMVVNNWFLSHLANILNAEVARPTCVESSALGVAYLAGLQAQVYTSLAQLEAMWQCDQRFTPKMKQTVRDKLYQGWLQAVDKVRTAH
ncbi:MAG: glycerol kinase GlpK [Oceanospirillaceae bacterium]|jgi:glycerol kinase|nr:glycerol kinase GlpK [Oceanospirillaceae bacterium]MBT4443281.1 glycerol kinase GlpK [Oceanospirillaceae bacterium]MBT6077452.1 glycerol kinase GlpK [Oceanospirillaceae bacterium]MBT7330779.1 glycerol kinase GlpK [Oceanospirillaceae bacterium]